jgi:hypothetical protein
VADPGKASSRQAALEEVLAKRRAAERRRAFVIVGISVLVAGLIIGVSVFLTTRDTKEKEQVEEISEQTLGSIGAPASACDAITATETDGNHEHLQVGTNVVYPTAPPAYGDHWSQPGVAPAPFDRKFYTAQDRPELEALVHNLEHGYTILWYDDTIADDPDAVEVVEAIADKFRGENDLRMKFIAAPWTAADVEESGAFPDGRHVAISHWSVGSDVNDPAQRRGVFQYCSEPSGAALEQFMLAYPYSDSPEPNAM